ncbi:hypothetical protein SAMN05421736_112135 [Evansella caseinilytica]|uniref:Uncharacterized protein n=1 Tax=Evansella caseinilytica TaxID=1503961 RepID=A0A1H3SYG2_9BACI|nr:hypothetical protein [Evansella caseinilytica]SDZ43066.1 hypothetical protein SAMN05421736_112135 [Evansella caseinilytica]
MNWFIGIAVCFAVMMYVAMEVATFEDRGRGFSSYFQALKHAFLFVLPLFAISGVIYYVFVN